MAENFSNSSTIPVNTYSITFNIEKLNLKKVWPRYLISTAPLSASAYFQCHLITENPIFKLFSGTIIIIAGLFIDFLVFFNIISRNYIFNNILLISSLVFLAYGAFLSFKILYKLLSNSSQAPVRKMAFGWQFTTLQGARDYRYRCSIQHCGTLYPGVRIDKFTKRILTNFVHLSDSRLDISIRNSGSTRADLIEVFLTNWKNLPWNAKLILFEFSR
jgi:hypothetical protein